jgi:glycosyltransferase involved in cell wall biosynthesis
MFMKFSVIIPVYNKANTVKSSLDSILAQTVDDFEIVVVDDGSTDSLNEVLSQYSGIKVVHQANAGVSVARNTGIESAEGEFVCFLDADDLWLPCHLEELLTRINENPEINYFITSHRTVFPDGRIMDSSEKLSALDGEFIISDNLFELLNKFGDSIVHTNCICVKRESLIKRDLWFEPGERIGEDTDMWYRIALREKFLLSKTSTNIYQKEYSTATQNSSNTQDWIFARRLPDIIGSSDISDDVKNECIRLVDRYTLACCRELSCMGQGKEARKKIKTVKNKSGKRYILTYILCHIPTALCRKILGVKGK